MGRVKAMLEDAALHLFPGNEEEQDRFTQAVVSGAFKVSINVAWLLSLGNEATLRRVRTLWAEEMEPEMPVTWETAR